MGVSLNSYSMMKFDQFQMISSYASINGGFLRLIIFSTSPDHYFNDICRTNSSVFGSIVLCISFRAFVLE
ncbi:unnamed protein product [Cuscuta europaea]|uniref:Uncharacterized protein n=1 Tax=Cuscuta europaea TaxID=41803 RepID=A0A9P1E3M1_CUSEU|nr:unnamed protein product [Cuscuta europaea]